MGILAVISCLTSPMLRVHSPDKKAPRVATADAVRAFIDEKGLSGRRLDARARG